MNKTLIYESQYEIYLEQQELSIIIEKEDFVETDGILIIRNAILNLQYEKIEKGQVTLILTVHDSIGHIRKKGIYIGKLYDIEYNNEKIDFKFNF